MKIELKKVHYSARMSEETNCFDAVLYIDGVSYGEVYNRGTGGSTECSDMARRILDAHGKTLPKIETDMDDPDEPSKKWCYEQDAETLIDEAFSVWLDKKTLKDDLASKILFTKPGSGAVYQTNCLNSAQKSFLRANPAAIKEKLGADILLNTLPFEEALVIFNNGTSA